MSNPVTYQQLDENMSQALTELTQLAGDIAGPSGVPWQDLAGTAALRLRVLADLIDRARSGDCEPCIAFPSPAELIGAIVGDDPHMFDR